MQQKNIESGTFFDDSQWLNCSDKVLITAMQRPHNNIYLALRGKAG